ncbi:MAG: hypothetical protein GC164_04235 [Phycisphaera sp.]|nr:hypothetical protein [Phycisphaera sp.]
MLYRVICPSCKKTVKSQFVRLGAVATCPYCQHNYAVEPRYVRKVSTTTVGGGEAPSSEEAPTESVPTESDPIWPSADDPALPRTRAGMLPIAQRFGDAEPLEQSIASEQKRGVTGSTQQNQAVAEDPSASLAAAINSSQPVNAHTQANVRHLAHMIAVKRTQRTAVWLLVTMMALLVALGVGVWWRYGRKSPSTVGHAQTTQAQTPPGSGPVDPSQSQPTTDLPEDGHTAPQDSPPSDEAMPGPDQPAVAPADSGMDTGTGTDTEKGMDSGTGTDSGSWESESEP